MDWELGLRVLSGVLGVVCWGGVLLVQQDEERRFRNRLVDWWIMVTATSESFLDKGMRASQSIARSLLVALAFVFGSGREWRRLLLGSAVCTQWSIAIITTATIRHAMSVMQFGVSDAAKSIIHAFAVALAISALLVRPSSLPRKVMRMLGLAVFLLSWLAAAVTAAMKLPAALVGLTVFVFGFAVDLALVPLNRQLFHHASGSRRAGLFLAGSILGPFALVAGLFALNRLVVPSGHLLRPGLLEIARNLATVVIVPNTMIAIGLTVFVLALGLNTAAWSVGARLLANFHDRGPSRAQVAALGTLLIGLAVAADPIAFVVKKLGLGE